MTDSTRPSGVRRLPTNAWFVVDLLLVVVFVLIGRRSHDESNALIGVLTTLWPFAVGLVVGWATVLGVRWRATALASGAVVWVSTVVLGMLLRVVSGQGVQVSFVIVATIVLGVFLLGSRLVGALVTRRRRGAGR
ncbi:DUF3054 domain-containing protein [Frigoribacterium sp. 2-23]|uniref:DUF3054 domain-containing protein n=1 Tax=Frigoribacterium sp. 2-23 TaxID=3415006 RepID=UPI003C6F6956